MSFMPSAGSRVRLVDGQIATVTQVTPDGSDDRVSIDGGGERKISAWDIAEVIEEVGVDESDRGSEGRERRRDLLAILAEQLSDPQRARVSRGDHRTVFPAHDLEPGASARVEYPFTGDVCVCSIAARAIAQPPDLRSFQIRGRVGGSKRRGRRASWLWSIALLAHHRNHPPARASLDSLVITRGEPPKAISREHMLSLLPFEALSADHPPLPLQIVVQRDERVALRITNQETHRRVSCSVSLHGVRL